MAKAAVNVTPAELREVPEIAAILDSLQKRRDKLRVEASVKSELRSYLEVRPLLPKVANHQSKKNVRHLQGTLVELEARLDRAVSIEEDVRTVLRMITRLEYEVKHVLFDQGLITSKSSKPSVELLLSLVVPELGLIRNRWNDLEVLCRDVHKRVIEAKDTVKLMSRLDDNLRWANRD